MAEEIIDYQNLDPKNIISTLESLLKRMRVRFPKRSLLKVCEQLLDIGAKACDRADMINKPIISLRLAIALLIVLIVAGITTTAMTLPLPSKQLSIAEFVQLLESAINDVVLIGAGIFFLITLEARIKRHRALKAIHELRAIAHIIDMHQLTKDPERVRDRGSSWINKDHDTLTAFELSRYLDYCSEMLSLTGKIAALYVINFDDPIALSAVNEIGSLATGLSRKVWQKLMILHSLHGKETTAAA